MHYILCSINVLSNTLQNKNGTLGKSATVINGVIKVFQDSRTSNNISTIWVSIQNFAQEHGISINIPSQAKGMYTFYAFLLT